MVGIWAWRLRSCVYAFAEKGRGAVKRLLLSQEKGEAIALRTVLLTHPRGDEMNLRRWAGSFPLCAPGHNDRAPKQLSPLIIYFLPQGNLLPSAQRNYNPSFRLHLRVHLTFGIYMK